MRLSSDIALGIAGSSEERAAPHQSVFHCSLVFCSGSHKQLWTSVEKSVTQWQNDSLSGHWMWLLPHCLGARGYTLGQGVIPWAQPCTTTTKPLLSTSTWHWHIHPVGRFPEGAASPGSSAGPAAHIKTHGLYPGCVQMSETSLSLSGSNKTPKKGSISSWKSSLLWAGGEWRRSFWWQNDSGEVLKQPLLLDVQDQRGPWFLTRCLLLSLQILHNIS